MPSISFLLRLLALPAILIVIAIRYCTVGTVFTNIDTRLSFKKTINAAFFQYMRKGLSMTDAQAAYVSMRALLKNLYAQYANIRGFGKQYTFAETSDFDSGSFLLADVTSDKNSPISLYYHGGCFALQLEAYHVEALVNFHKAYPAMSVRGVDYSLTCNRAHTNQ